MAGWADNSATVDGKALPRSRPAVPNGFDDMSEFLQEMRERYDAGVCADDHNIKAGQEDASFVAGDQWDPIVKQKRIDKKKPVLTVNRLVAFIAQIIGNRLMNETEIRVEPDKEGTKEIADIRQGLIKSIYKNSQANFARDQAMLYQVIGGQGFFTLGIDYAYDDVFEQKISLKPAANPYAAVFDPMGIEPSGEDCEWGFVGEDVPTATYKRKWPWAGTASFEDANRWDSGSYWHDRVEDTVHVVSYWRMVTEGTKVLALYTDGTVHDVTDKEEFEYVNFVETRSDGTPYIREVPKRFARLYICAGNEVLEGPYDYPISSIPIYRVPGWEVNDGKKLHRWGLTRFLKDPQRLHNYWRSTVAEQLVAAPRNKWLTTPEAVKGFERRWREAPTSDDPFLFYTDGETAPIHVPPPGIDAALVNEAGISTQDLKDISNIHEASLGMPSNEVSKVAIQQRQMVSDVGTFIYSDHLRIADERCARNINELIGYIYDTKRTITIIGPDDKSALQVINDPSDPDSDVTIGKYAVTVTVGPATATKRALAAEQMMAFVNAIPQVAGNVMDLVADAQDWPKSNEFARRFRMMLPAGMISQDDMTPEELQQQQQNQQVQQLQAQLTQAQQEAAISGAQAKAANDQSRAHLATAQAYQAIANARARLMEVQGKIDDREFAQIMSTLDQHNSLIHEDRTFAHDQQNKALEGGLKAMNTFSDVANADRDFQLERQFQQNEQDAGSAPSGEE